MSLSGDKLVKLGQQASFVFLTENKPLDEIITKLASENDLNPEQVRRVCQIANQSTMIGIYKNGNDNTQEFKVACADDILKNLGCSKEPSSIKSAQYLQEPTLELRTGIKVASEEKPRMSKMKARETRIILEKTAARLEAELKQKEDDVTAYYYKYSSAIDSLYEVIKQAIMRGFSWLELKKAALLANQSDPQTTEGILKEVEQKLAMDPQIQAAANAQMGSPIEASGTGQEPEQGILSRLYSGAKGAVGGLMDMFKGGEAVDPSLISDKMQDRSKDVPIKIINGRHPYYGALRTVFDARKTLKASDREARRVKDKLTVVREDIGSAKKQEGEWY